MANGVGGEIILGVKEDDQAVAAGLSPVSLSDGERLRMHQIVADLVAPPPPIHLIPVEAADAQADYYLLVVPPSVQAPLAVRVGASLRYLFRDGPRSRPLAEQEVASFYRSRFTSAREQDKRSSEIAVEGPNPLDLTRNAPRLGFHRSGLPSARLHRPALPPERRRSGPAVLGRPVRMRHVRDLGRELLSRGPSSDRHGERFCDWSAELHADGAAYCAVPIAALPEDVYTLEIRERDFVCSAANVLNFGLRHITGAGAFGGAVVAMGLEAMWPLSVVAPQLPGQGETPLSGSRQVTHGPVSAHTLDLDAMAADGREFLHGLRLALTDLFQAFGVLEVRIISDDGEQRRPLLQQTSPAWETWVGIYPWTDQPPPAGIP